MSIVTDIITDVADIAPTASPTFTGNVKFAKGADVASATALILN